MSREKFVEWVGDAIVTLPHYLKAVLRIVDDPDVDDDGRVLAAGALLHCISGQNAIPGVVGTLAFVDDVLVLRLVLERLSKSSADAIAQHVQEEPMFESLAEELASARAFLGPLIKVLDRAVDGFPKINHQGHTAKQCVHDTESGNWLYDTVQESVVEQFELDEDEVMREIKQVDNILPPLRSRIAALNA